MAYNLSVINEDWVFPNSNFNYTNNWFYDVSIALLKNEDEDCKN